MTTKKAANKVNSDNINNKSNSKTSNTTANNTNSNTAANNTNRDNAANKTSSRSTKSEGKNRSKVLSWLIALGVIIVIGLLIFLMVRSLSPRENPYAVYNGYDFTPHPQLANVWVTEINVGNSDERVEFRYHPLDLENITYNDDANQYLFLTQVSGGVVHIALSEEVLASGSGLVGLAGFNLARMLRYFLGFEVLIAAEGLEGYDWIDCEGADINNNVILLRRGDLRVDVEAPFCTVFYFEDPQDSVKLTSLFLYKVFGIMD